MNDYVSQFRSKMTYYWLSAHFNDLRRFSVQVMAVARQEGDELVQTAAYLGFARHLRAAGRFNLARAGVEHSYNRADAIGNTVLMVDALVERAAILLHGYFDPLGARSDLEQALHIASAAQYAEGITQVYVGLSQAARHQEDAEAARCWAVMAVRSARQTLDNPMLAEAGLAHGLALIALKRHREADDVLDDALSLSKRLVYNVYRPLIAIAMVTNQPRFTPEHFRILTAYATGNDWRAHFAVRWAAYDALTGAYAVHRHGEDAARALLSADRLRELAVEAEHPPLAMAYHRWMAYLLTEFGEGEERATAPDYVAAWLALAREYQNPYQQMLAHAAMGMTQAHLGHARASYEGFREARQVAQSLRFHRMGRLLTVQMLLSGLVWQVQRMLGWLGLGRAEKR